MHYRVFQLEVISIAMFGNLTPNCFGCWEFCPNSIHRWWQLPNSNIHHLTENLYFVRLLKTFGRSRSGGGGFLVGYFLVFYGTGNYIKSFVCLSICYTRSHDFDTTNYKLFWKLYLYLYISVQFNAANLRLNVKFVTINNRGFVMIFKMLAMIL